MSTPKFPGEGGPTASSPPTPGVGLGPARHPSAPTLPGWDPNSMGLLLQQMANQLYAPPPLGAAEPPAPRDPHSEIRDPRPAIDGGSPFHVPLQFDALGFSGFSAPPFPLLDAFAPPASESSPAPAPPSYSALSIDHFELSPTEDPAIRTLGSTQFDPNAVRREFPILDQRINGHRLVWLDNAATTQKPQTVIDRLSRFYETENSNIHRAAHTLAARATDAYESARETVRRFLGAATKSEIVFVRGATEGINLLANSWGERNVGAGDEIVISWLEHHANIVPWQMLASRKGAKLRVAPVDETGQIRLDEYDKLLTDRTKLVSVTQVSNALGTVTPIEQMIAMAHRRNIPVIVDGAQAVSHKPVDVQAMDADFYVFSGHKVFAPTGIGVVYGKQKHLDAMPPWQGGGNMISDVTFDKTVYQPPPGRFEAGTGNIADAVGLGAALDWLMRLGLPHVERYEHELLEYGTEQLQTVPGLTIIGTAKEKAGVISFILDGQQTETVGGLLDREGIAVRSGHHCAQPILRRFGLEATVRASLAPYNTREDLDALVAACKRLQSGRAPGS